MFSIIKKACKASYKNTYDNNIVLNNNFKSMNIQKYCNKNIENNIQNKELNLFEISKDLNILLQSSLEKVIEKKPNGWFVRYSKEVYLDKYGIGKLNIYDKKIFKLDNTFLDDVFNSKLLLENQYKELLVLVENNFKMQCHPVIYSEKEGIVLFSTKTSKDKPFSYYSENKLQTGNVIKLGEKSYLSDLKYKVVLFKKDLLKGSIKY